VGDHCANFQTLSPLFLAQKRAVKVEQNGYIFVDIFVLVSVNFQTKSSANDAAKWRTTFNF
jgi:hypothetical protein